MVESTGALAQAIGLAKEVADARAGSGFSFNDMAANLAGTRFGETGAACRRHSCRRGCSAASPTTT